MYTVFLILWVINLVCDGPSGDAMLTPNLIVVLLKLYIHWKDGRFWIEDRWYNSGINVSSVAVGAKRLVLFHVDLGHFWECLFVVKGEKEAEIMHTTAAHK